MSTAKFVRRKRPLLLAATVIALSCSALTSAEAASSDDVWLRFDSPVGSPLSLVNSGDKATTQSIVFANGGTVSRATSFFNAGGAADFPAFNVNESPLPPPPRAVIAVMDSGTALSPGAAAFSFGADFKLDSGTTVGAAGSTDNGNNIIQRGIANGLQPQFKIQADLTTAGALRISCEMRKVGGSAVVARTTGAVSTDTWYRAKCTRTPGANDTVTLSVRPINATTGALGTAIVTTSGLGSLGSMDFASTVPLSIGGKLNPATTGTNPQPPTVMNASDQFNGLIDNAILNIS